MKEIIEKLLATDVLSEETKAEVSTMFETGLKTLREDITAEVRVQLTEEFVKAQEQLVEAIEAKLNDQIAIEVNELKEDIDNFRDLEVEYAEKFADEKAKMAIMLGEQIDELVDKLDVFIDKSITEETQELQEDINEVRKLEFGRKIFEAMESEFKKFRKVDTLKIEQELTESKDRLFDTQKKLERLEREKIEESRNSKLDSLLEGLEGTSKEQLKVILSNVSTDKLDEAFKIYAPRVLKESLNNKSAEKESALLESKDKKEETVLVTGNEVIVEEKSTKVEKNDTAARFRVLAGLGK